MTKPIDENVICPNCGAENCITVYASINATLNPELVEKMKSGELFIYECPKCGKKYRFCNGIRKVNMQFTDKVDENNQRELDENNQKKTQ